MLQLFFVEDINSPELTGDNAHHAERVLRMSVGEELLVSDGKGNWARCEITSAAKKNVNLAVLESGYEVPDTQEISVLQAIPKSDRAKETVELLTASGISEIYPWQAQRAIGKESDKWAVAAIEASKQSRRFHIPKVWPNLDTESAIKIFKDFEQVLICHEEYLLLRQMKTISITWSTQDVLDVAEQMGHNISEVQADYILDRIHKNHDACIGINWDVIEATIQHYKEK